MAKDIIRVDIIDSEPKNPKDKILSSYYLSNPDMDKLSDFKQMVETSRKIDGNPIEGIWDIEDFIEENFEIIPMKRMEIKW